MLRVFKRIANRSAVGAVALYDAVTGTGQYAPKKKGSKKKGRKRESKKSSLLSEARERRERARRQGNPDDTDPPASDDEDDDPYGAEAAPDDPLHPALPEPEWPNVDVDDIPDLPPPQRPPPREPDPAPWPDYDVDDYAPKSEQRPPMQSLPVERGREPLPPPVSPPPNRKTYRTTHTHGGTMKSADTYVQMIDNSTPASYSTTCREAAEQARRDAATKEEDAKKLRLEASDFDTLIGVGNKEAAQKLRAEAANCEQDSRNRLVWAARLDGMANDADSKIAS